MCIRVDGQRLLERRLADQELLNPRNYLVGGPSIFTILKGSSSMVGTGLFPTIVLVWKSKWR
jgi:hypothetical protein